MDPRIFCIGRNYAAHVRELGHAEDGECVVFMKPASCIVPVGEPLVLPRDQGAVHYEAEMTVLLTGGGRDIPEAEAIECIAGLGLGIDLTLRDLQARLREKGAPWERCKSFDGAAPLGEWQPYLDQDLQALHYSCHVNGTLRQHADTAQMLFPVTRIIHLLSSRWALLPGDIIYTGTPAGVGALQPGDTITLDGDGLGSAEWQCR